MYSWPSSIHIQSLKAILATVAMATLKNLSFFGENAHFQLLWEKFWARKTRVAPLNAASHAHSKALQPFFRISYRFRAIDLWTLVARGHEIWRNHWPHATAEATITKFGTVIELIKTNIFYHYAKSLSLMPWVPDEKNWFSAKNVIFSEGDSGAEKRQRVEFWNLAWWYTSMSTTFRYVTPNLYLW